MTRIRLRIGKHGQRGAAAVEFAIVSLLLVFFIYAIAAFGVILSAKNSFTHAAGEGARAALSVTDLPSATLDARRVAQATTTVAKSLNWMGGNYHASDTTAVIAGCDSAGDTNKCITVTITYPYQSRPLIPPAPGLGLVTPNQLKATAVVRLS